MGDSITSGTVDTFEKAVGDYVNVDDVVAILETDKVSVDVRSPIAGVITSVNATPGDDVPVGMALFNIDTTAAAAPKAVVGSSSSSTNAPTPPPPPPQAAPSVVVAAAAAHASKSHGGTASSSSSSSSSSSPM